MVTTFMEGRTLSQACKDKRLFIIDFHLVEGLPVRKPETEVSFGGDELKLVLQTGRQVRLVAEDGDGWRTLTKQEVKRY
jgi:hypothetical protein